MTAHPRSQRRHLQNIWFCCGLLFIAPTPVWATEPAPVPEGDVHEKMGTLPIAASDTLEEAMRAAFRENGPRWGVVDLASLRVRAIDAVLARAPALHAALPKSVNASIGPGAIAGLEDRDAERIRAFASAVLTQVNDTTLRLLAEREAAPLLAETVLRDVPAGQALTGQLARTFGGLFVTHAEDPSNVNEEWHQDVPSGVNFLCHLGPWPNSPGAQLCATDQEFVRYMAHPERRATLRYLNRGEQGFPERIQSTPAEDHQIKPRALHFGQMLIFRFDVPHRSPPFSRWRVPRFGLLHMTKYQPAKK